MPKATSYNVLEVACFNLESCLLAEKAGADRIEFCRDYSSGGMTPTYDDILKAKKQLHIPLHVIIRPRPGNFVYTTQEKKIIEKEIAFCEKRGINGVVFGALTADGAIDIEANKPFLEMAGGMSTTFHRAIDACVDLEKSMEMLIELGFTRVLTSGGKASAIEGIQRLHALQKNYGHAITIIPGGGIRHQNIQQLVSFTGCKEFHTAALKGHNELVDPGEIKAILRHMKQE